MPYALQAGSGDNLGDHTATQNLVLGANSLSGDGDSEGIFVSADGMVGIGTGSPEAALHVLADSTSAETGIKLSQAQYNSLIYHDEEGNLILRKANKTNQLVLYSTGRVGIGTDSPQAKLDVAGAVALDEIVFADGTKQTTVSGAYTVASGDFVTPNGADFVYTNNTGAGGQRGTRTSGNNLLLAPVHLPHYATITKVTAHVYDTASADLIVELKRGQLGSTDTDMMVYLMPQTSAGNFSAETTNISHSFVDNRTKTYFLEVRPNNANIWSTNLLVCAVVIEWEMR